MDIKQLWKNCLNEIETDPSVSKANFRTWFTNTNIIKEDGGIIHLGVPNEFVRDWLKNKFHKVITKTIADQFSTMRGVEYVISKIDSSQKDSPSQNIEIFTTTELPLKDLYINKEDNLNPKYTFDNFVVGPFNELAHAAAQAIVSRPGVTYNPFFIYGSTGLGKTHLLQAIGSAMKQKNANTKVYYITLEKFASDFVNAIQNKRAESFKEKYRKYDLLIIDDIQLIGKMDKMQEELFNTFNTFYQNNKPIIFSSDKHPNYINGLEDRLKSRFQQGMVVDINEPEYESRLAILKTKAKENNIYISDEVMEYVATLIEGNIRELEGSLNSIIFQKQLKKRELNLQEVKNLIKNNVKPKKNVAIKDVVKTVADHYNLDENTIYEKTRRKEIVKARQIVMYILREDFNVSYPLIGQKLGGKDHTTVIHSYEKIKTDLKEDQQLVQEIEQIRMMFK